jgi:two-component system, OmpR family, alkaline phosphatase synthesis response regulator PhoP
MGKINLTRGKLLIVSEKENDLQAITSRLEKEGYEVLDADFNNIIESLKKYSPLAVIINMEVLEIKLFEICRILRLQQQFNGTAIIFLSHFTDDEIILKCMETGADLYITKPVSPTLLLSKINAIKRRFRNEAETSAQLGGIVIDRERYLVLYNKEPISLPRKEFELLALLVSKTGKVFLRNEILNLVWNSQVDIRTVDVHVCKLRQKLGNNSIKTIKGIGYKMSV